MLDIEAGLNDWEAAVLAELVQGKEVVGWYWFKIK